MDCHRLKFLKSNKHFNYPDNIEPSVKATGNFPVNELCLKLTDDCYVCPLNLTL
jgi:hypothetical protein